MDAKTKKLIDSLPDKKITRTTFKSFITNTENLYINVTSKFNGMSDMVEVKDDFFALSQPTERNLQHTLGIDGVWLVGNSRDCFNYYNDDIFIGIEVLNAVGSFIIAVKKSEIS